MGDAAGQQGEGLELLRLQQLFLRAFLQGDVTQVLHDPLQVPILIEERIGTDVHPDPRGLDIFLQLGRLPGPAGFRRGALGARLVPADQLVAFFPLDRLGVDVEETVSRLVVADDAVLGVLDAQDVGHGVEDAREQRLRPFIFVAGRLLFAAVGEETDDARHAVDDDPRRADIGPKNAAVLAQAGNGSGHLDLAAVQGREGLPDVFQGFAGMDVADGQGEQFLPGVAEHAANAVVDIADPSRFPLGDHDPFHGVGQQRQGQVAGLAFVPARGGLVQTRGLAGRGPRTSCRRRFPGSFFRSVTIDRLAGFGALSPQRSDNSPFFPHP